MTKYYLLALLITVCFLTTANGAENLFSGARAGGMANAAVALYDFWAISHNQAGITKINTLAAGIHTESRFLQKEMSLASVAVIYPLNSGNLGASLQYFGSSLYSEGKAGLAYARMFGDKLSTGLQLNYMFTAIGEGYGSTGTISAELGFLYELFPDLIVAAHIFNPAKASLKTECLHQTEEYISSILRLGAAYSFSQNVLLSLEVGKDLRHDAVLKLGIEYRIGDIMYVRTGISTNPVMNAFGFGLLTGKIRMDICTAYHYVLGYSPQAGIIYSFE